MLLPLWSFLAASLSLQQQQPPSTRSYRKYQSIIVDVENLRGRSGFALSHADVLESMQTWSVSCTPGARVVLAIDHGKEPSTFLLDDYAILFSGLKKADDTIANSILPFLCEQKVGRIGVVTADRGLTYRCLSYRHVEIIRPEQLLQDLERILQRNLLGTSSFPEDGRTMNDAAGMAEGQTNSNDNAIMSPSGNVTEKELALGSELLEIDANLRNRRGFKNRQRKQLRMRSQTIWRQLQDESPRMIERIEEILQNGSANCASLQDLSVMEQRQLVIKWEMAHQFMNNRRRETTQDRIVLAERVRQNLLDSGKTTEYLREADPEYFRPKLPDKFVDDRDKDEPPPHKSNGKKLTVVVLSDTHGMENELPSPLPAGDILLHLGDFADDIDPKLSMARFDTWLGQQPHPTKIVIRGNHDPRRGFLRNARYITQPETAVLGGYKFVFCPFISGGLRKKELLPNRYHVLASHVPPHKRLDRCATGKNAGSKMLAKATAKKPPLLWLCGHIHEGRGVLRDHDATVLINAANANPGKASCIAYGPTVVQLGGTRTTDIEILEMDGQLAFMNQDNEAFFATKIQNGCAPLLLAVDLGLRTGMSLLDQQGRVLRYELLQYASADDLCRGAERIMREWQQEYNEAYGAYLSHLAIEGSDPPLLDAWRNAASRLKHPPAILYVRPEEWRSDVLTLEEEQSGATAKEASERLAQEILMQHGLEESSMVATDVAESILLGVHVARRLGWVTADMQQQLAAS